MKRVICFAVMILSSVFLFGQWTILTDGNALPTEVDPVQLEPIDGILDITWVIDDPQDATNQVLLIEDMAGTGQGYWQHNLIINDMETYAMTTIIRARGTDEALGWPVQGQSDLRYIDFRMDTEKWQENMRVSSDGLNLERMAVTEPFDASIWHTFRFTMENEFNYVQLFIDEDPIPFLSGDLVRAGAGAGTGRIFFGDSGLPRLFGI